MGKNNSRPVKAKPKMVHKELVKPEKDPPRRLSPASKTSPVIAVKPAAVTMTVKPSVSAPDDDNLKIVRALIAALPKVTLNPETAVDNIYREIKKIWRAGQRPPADLDDSIEDGRLQAHANRIHDGHARLPTDENPEVLHRQIKDSFAELTKHKQEARVFTLLGVTDSAALTAKIAQAYEQGAARVAEEKLQDNIKVATQLLYDLSTARDPDKQRAELLAALDHLGPHRHRAFPASVTTAEAMTAMIDTAYDLGQQKADEAAREAYEHKARSQLTYFAESSWQPKNPDLEVAALRATVAVAFNGDITCLVTDWRGVKKTAQEIERDIDQRHSKAMDKVADDLLRQRGITPPSRGWFSSLSRLEEVKEQVAFGRNPEERLADIEDKSRVFFTYDVEKTDATTLATLRVDMAQNKALRYALVTQHYAGLGEDYALMLAKTLKAIEAARGLDALEAAITRVGLTAETWNALKVFLAQKTPEPEIADETAAKPTREQRDRAAQRQLANFAGTEWKVTNPDLAVAALRTTIATVLDGDSTRLSPSWRKQAMTAAQVEAEIDRRHDNAISQGG